VNKRIIFLLLAVLAIYQYSSKDSTGLVNSVTANSIDSECDAVVFTTASCPYCQKARVLLDKKEVAWCEFDVNESQVNRDLYKEHGGNGVPLAIIGSTKLLGFNEANYLNAIDKI
jgi:glutaredoxin